MNTTTKIHQRLTISLAQITTSAPHILKNELELIDTLQKIDPFLRRTKRKFIIEALTQVLSKQKKNEPSSSIEVKNDLGREQEELEEVKEDDDNDDDTTDNELLEKNEKMEIDKAWLDSSDSDTEKRKENQQRYIEEEKSLEFVQDQALYGKRSNQMNRSMLNLYRRHKPTTSSILSPDLSPTSLFSNTLKTNPTSELNSTSSSAPNPTTSTTQTLKRASKNVSTNESTNKKRRKKDTDQAKSNIRLSDLGGIDHSIETLIELVAMPLLHPEIYHHTGVPPPIGILLHGPPGCGKTSLANAIANELDILFISISGPSLVSGMSGESEKQIREVFQEAMKSAPCLMFIDEIDSITPKRESVQREMERRMVAQFLTCMDDLAFEKTGMKPVIIMGATNRPDALDSALRRAGRFDREIAMGVPDEASREKMLQVLSRKLRLSGDFDFKALAKLTPGYVGADLKALTSEAGVIALKRIFQNLSTSEISLNNHTFASTSPSSTSSCSSFLPSSDALASLPFLSSLTPFADKTIVQFLQKHPLPLTAKELDPIFITQQDFLDALKLVQPSSKREGFATVPDVTWDQIGALTHIREELRLSIIEPILRPEPFREMGITTPSGVLLWGPPGCGKTLLAKAVANESHMNFISVKGPELLNKYVGESERAVRLVFERARASSPCVIFFDELDALVPRRDESKSEATARVVNTLLTELDGMAHRAHIFVIAATNRPDMLDPAILRPGRFDKMLYVELPTCQERYAILTTLTQKTPTLHTLPLLDIAKLTEGYSGADLAALVKETSLIALKLVFKEKKVDDQPYVLPKLTFEHVQEALKKMKPSVSEADRVKYDRLRDKLSGTCS